MSNGEMTSSVAFGLILNGRVGDVEGFRKKIQSVAAKSTIVQLNKAFCGTPPAEVAPVENTMRAVPSWRDRREQSQRAKAAMIAKVAK